MEEYFEKEYEDEFDVLRELEEDQSLSAKRTLFQKSTPLHRTGLNDSFPQPLAESPPVVKDAPKRRLEQAFNDRESKENLRTPDSKKQRTAFSPGLQCVPEISSTTDLTGDDSNYSDVSVQKFSRMSAPLQCSANRNVVSCNIPRCEFVAVTSSDGCQKGYLTVKDSTDENQAQVTRNGKNLLGVDFQALKKQILDQKRSTALEDLEKAQMNNLAASRELQQLAEESEMSGVNSRLWVEQYTPQRYTDLMSVEGVNRALLKWLKMWDHLVFNKPKPDKSLLRASKIKESEGKKGKILNQQGGNKKPVVWRSEFDVEEEYDATFRPVRKVVLLSGKPGLGKTTLAHVITKHAGYKVVEMNASDERTASAFNNKIDDALTMKAVMGADPRPNCLVIDEIDGAPKPAITALINRLTEHAVSQENKKKAKHSPVLRPIICICNDLYAPSLRPLKQLALVLNFPQPCPSKLSARLLEITQAENMDTDMTTLLALCEKTGNDIRSCLNTLQCVNVTYARFIHIKETIRSYSTLAIQALVSVNGKGLTITSWYQGTIYGSIITSEVLLQAISLVSYFPAYIFIHKQQSMLSLRNILSMNIGSKDENKSLMSFWQEIFQLPRLQRASMPAFNDNAYHTQASIDCTTPKARFGNIYSSSQACGEYEKLVQGLHENYLHVKFKDYRQRAAVNGAEWLCFTDLINKEIFSHQLYQLSSYLSFLPVAFHFNFAAVTKPKITYPKKQYEVTSRRSNMVSLVTSLIHEVSPAAALSLNESIAVLDLLPCIISILQPNLRPVNIQLYSASERQSLQQLIHTMICYNLSYVQEKGSDGQYTYTLEPPVDELTKFPDQKKPQRGLTYASKQMIAGEILLEKLRRLDCSFKQRHQGEPVTPSTSNNSKINCAKTPRRKNANISPAQTPKSSIPNHKQALQPIAFSPSNQIATDFFGRPIKVTKTVSLQEENTNRHNALLKTDVYFKFKEGFSNAVRKKVTLNDLL